MWMFIWIASFCFVPSYQISDPNCLRANPEALDGAFNLFNKYDDVWNVTKKDVAQHTTLFSTRFKRAHELTKLQSAAIEFIWDAVSRSSSSWRKNIQFYFSLFNKEKDLQTRVNRYKEGYETVRKINSYYGSIVGLYLEDPLNDFASELKVIESVFGTKENSTFQIGHLIYSCFSYFKSEYALKYLQRLDFITCYVFPINKPSPEETADDIISTCILLRDMATSIKLTAEFMCGVRYPSYGTNPDGVVGSVVNFQRFWCRIVYEIARMKSTPRIILMSAFDETPNDYKTNATNVMSDPDHHSGWWRRRDTTSYAPSSFVEKVEELPGGREPGTCTAECSFCGSSEECCEKRSCSLDTSFQPLETGQPPLVCQSLYTTCAPRPPKIPTSGPSFTNLNGTSTSSVGSNFPTKVTIIVLSATIFVLMVAAILIHWGGKKNNILTKQEYESFRKGTVVSSGNPFSDNRAVHSMAYDLPYDERTEIAQSDFEIYENQILGSGEFGIVMKGLVGGYEAAVKSIRYGTGKIYFKALLLELKILSYLGPHENIVNLLGAHTTQINSGKLYLFLEYCPCGNLLQFLRSHRDHFLTSEAFSEDADGEGIQLTCKDLLQWSLQISTAMEHLAEKKVIHGDIAARNILVFSREQVKLTDFGLSRRLHEHSTYVKKNQEPLPWRHMSLEALRDLSFSVESDVWSFGVTLWEIFSIGEVPYPGHSCSQNFMQLLAEGLRPDCPRHAHSRIFEVMTTCWTSDVQLRPEITQIRTNLNSALDDLYTKRHYIHPTDI